MAEAVVPKVDAAPRIFVLMRLASVSGRSSESSSALVEHEGLQAREVFGHGRGQHFLADFLGRDQLPRVDGAVFVQVDAPLRAVGAEPAILIDFAVIIRIDFAIALFAVEVIGPNVDLVVAVRIEEAAHQTALRVLEGPAAGEFPVGDLVPFNEFDLAAREFRVARRADGNPRLLRLKLKNLSGPARAAT